MSTDYSQSGEQAVILEAVRDLPVGRFLDIGAGDGETFSNTRALAEQGWGGVLVEPAAWAFDKLIDLYAGDDDVSLVSAVVTAEQYGIGLEAFHYVRGDHLSTTVDAELRKWPGVRFERVWAGNVTMHNLLSWLGGGITAVSIDTEGRTVELVEAYMTHVMWKDVQVLCYEPDVRGPARFMVSAPPEFEEAARTPNNVIWRRR